MKAVVILTLVFLSAVSCTFMETKVSLFYPSVTLNAHGNVTTHTAQLSVTLSVNLLNVILHVPNPKTQFAM